MAELPVIVAWPRVGRFVYAGAALALGLIGLHWGDFAIVWQPVPPSLPHRVALAYVAALLLALGGAATFDRRSARVGAVALGLVFVAVSLPWLRRVVHYPRLAGTWLGFFEEFSLVLAAVAVYVTTRRARDPRVHTESRVILSARRLFGVCALSFGVAHFAALPQTAAMVPAWLPPNQRFWAIVTGTCHLLAGAALISGIAATLAARLLALMLVGFGVLVWAPNLVAAPGAHMTWAGNAVNLAIAGAAWVIADATAPSERAERTSRTRPL
ncbi:MAG TPA: DoxX family membrane protein [Gemmatimonadaceae bacterium]|jgi:uncharacterized membrane protein YphA (DoxX/SURF4 family)|nr:DoxX family membrane protein [Gemmatimonadaceae bacterium]